MSGHILVVDDDEKITSLLKRSLVFEGYNVTVANHGQDGLRKLMELQPEPDMVILDVMMPQLDGWEVVRRIRTAEIKVPILMLTAKDEIEDRVKGLDLGADDYLVKPFALDELLARVRALLRRRTEQAVSQADQILRFEDLELNLDSRQAFRQGYEIELTTKEFDLVHLFMSNARKVLSRDVIMDKIWGYDYSGESNVLEVYIATIRQKLEAHGGSRLIQTVRGLGYVMRGGN